MAIWQYIAYLIPENSLSPDGTLTGLAATADSFEHPSLAFNIAPTELEQLVSAFLPPRKSWHKNLHTWGDEERDDLNIWYAEDRIQSIRARLDLRDITRERIGKLVTLARQAGCCFLDGRTFEIVRAEEEMLLESIRRSRSAKFVADPSGFLQSQSREPA